MPPPRTPPRAPAVAIPMSGVSVSRGLQHPNDTFCNKIEGVSELLVAGSVGVAAIVIFIRFMVLQSHSFMRMRRKKRMKLIRSEAVRRRRKAVTNNLIAKITSGEGSLGAPDGEPPVSERWKLTREKLETRVEELEEQLHTQASPKPN